MRQFSFIFRIVEAIEIQLPRKLDIKALSAILNVSRWHLQHEFKRFTGMSVGRYYRLRLLTLAISEVANSNQRILDIALDFGFESQEAFYRVVRQTFEVSPKNFRRNRALAKFIGIPPIDIFYLEFFQRVEKDAPMEVIFSSCELMGVYRNFSSVFFEPQDVSTGVKELWDNFSQTTCHWPHENRQYFTLEYRNNCSGRSGQFQMLATCDGEEETTVYPLAKIHISERKMWKFTLPNEQFIPALFVFLHRVFCPQNKLVLCRLPFIWQLGEQGQLQFWVELKPSQALNVLPPSVQYLDESVMLKPRLFGELSAQAIPEHLVQKSQRLEYVLDRYQALLPIINAGKQHLLIGRTTEHDYTPQHDFQVNLFTEGGARSMCLEEGKYLKCGLIGSLREIGEDLDSVYFSHLSESRYFLRQGFEWITCAEKRSGEEWYIELLIPVAKR
ncbi:helix-turn-helix transcriptional regulator [Vibrio profundi]|uniref:helix-turn-helix transcriptional regulator n=1 Tax=Vibrio profundi TaxID=1774960 RepID=UPI0037367A0B